MIKKQIGGNSKILLTDFHRLTKILTPIMEKADLPKEKASEPCEEARQPTPETEMSTHGQNQSKKLTFAKDTDMSEKTFSQRSSNYKDLLSQPPTELSHSQKLVWLQKRRTAGLWAQCDDCDRWRYLPDVLDRYELPKKWYCWMNPDKNFASCSTPEAPIRTHDEEDLIHSEYAAGSLVWARMSGWPWWPAMVDDCPDAEQYYWLDGFSDIPTHYNVVFFDNMEVTRAWIAPDQLKPYGPNKKMFKLSTIPKKYYNRVKAAMSQADEAEKLPLENRLSRYSFIARHKGKIGNPKQFKKSDLKRYQRQFKRKFNIDFPIESSESDNETMCVNTTNSAHKQNNNVIILGTPKKPRRAKNDTAIPNKDDNEKAIDVPSTEQNNFLPKNQSQKCDKTESAANTDKPSNSMVVQVGSTEAESIENDTSTTYVPENISQPFGMSIRMDTPDSDDFEF